jgi:hypothetical protein
VTTKLQSFQSLKEWSTKLIGGKYYTKKSQYYVGFRLTKIYILWTYYIEQLVFDLLSESWDDNKAVLMKDYDHCVDGNIKVLELCYLKAAEDPILLTTIRG